MKDEGLGQKARTEELLRHGVLPSSTWTWCLRSREEASVVGNPVSRDSKSQDRGAVGQERGPPHRAGDHDQDLLVATVIWEPKESFMRGQDTACIQTTSVAPMSATHCR